MPNIIMSNCCSTCEHSEKFCTGRVELTCLKHNCRTVSICTCEDFEPAKKGCMLKGTYTKIMNWNKKHNRI